MDPKLIVLRQLIDAREQMQQGRIRFQHRGGAVERGSDDADPFMVETYERYHDLFGQLEADLTANIKAIARESEIVQALCTLPGVKDVLASRLVSFLDIEEAKTISALWKVSGYGLGEYWVKPNVMCKDKRVRDIHMAPVAGYQWKGKGDKKEKVWVEAVPKDGWVLKQMADKPLEHWCSPYNQRIKPVLYLIVSSFIKLNGQSRKLASGGLSKPLALSPYRVFYLEAKTEEFEKHAGIQKQHASLRAIRKTGKLFLGHLWLTWRRLEDLPVTDPYIIANQDEPLHTRMLQPEDFGWPNLAGPEEQVA